MPDNKVLSNIASNIECIKRLFDEKTKSIDESLKKLISGEDVKSLTDTVLEKIDEQTNNIKTLNENLANTISIVKAQKELMDSKDIYETELKPSIDNINVALTNILTSLNNEFAEGKVILNTIAEMLGGIYSTISKEAGTKLQKMDIKDPKLMEKVLFDGEKSKEKINKLSSLIDMMSKLKKLSFKDLLTANLKLKKIEDIYDNTQKLMKKIGDDKEVEKMFKFIANMKGMVIELSLMPVLAVPALFGVRVLDWLLFGSKLSGKGLINIFTKLAEVDDDAIENGNKKIKQMALGTAFGCLIALMLVGMWELNGWKSLLGALVLSACVLVLTQIFEYASKHSDEIEKGAKTLSWMALGVTVLGLSIGILFWATKNINLKQFIVIALTIGGLIALTYLAGKLEENIIKGAFVMLIMGAALIVLGIGLMITYNAVEGVDWKEFGIMLLSVLLLGVIFSIAGLAIELILPGAIAMAAMGAAMVLLGFGLMLTYSAVEGVDWKEFGIMLLSVLLLGVIFSIAGLAIELILPGAIAMAAMGAAMVLLGFGLMITYSAVEDVDWKEFGIMLLSILLLGVIFSAAGLAIGLILPGAIAMAAMGAALVLIGLGLMITYKAVEDVEWKEFGIMLLSILLLGVIFSAIGIASPLIIIGSAAVITMGASLILFGIGLMVALNATKETTIEDVGIMMALIGGLATAYALVGVLSLPIIIGSVAIIAMGVSLIIFALGLKNMVKVSKDVTLKDVGIMMALIGGLAIAYSGAGLMLPTVMLGVFTIGLIAISLAILAIAIKAWQEIDDNMIDTVEKGIKTILRVFGIQDSESPDTSGKLSDLGGSIINFISSIFNFGKVFFVVGSLILIAFALSFIADAIARWKDVDTSSIGTIETTIKELKRIFGFDESDDVGLNKTPFGVLGSMFEFGANLFKSGSKLMELGLLLMAVGIIEKLIDAIGKMDSTEKIKPLLTGIDMIRSYFIDTQKFEGMEDGVEIFGDAIDDLLDIIDDFSDAKEDLESFVELTEKLISALSGDMNTFTNNANSMSVALTGVFRAFEDIPLGYSFYIDDTIKLFDTIAKMGNTDVSRSMGYVDRVLGKVNRVKLKNVNALTDLFKTWNDMNDFDLFSGFQNSADELTECIIQLMDAINGNTSALNTQDNTDQYAPSPYGGDENDIFQTVDSSQNSGEPTVITNIEELAEAIGKKISKSMSVDCLNTIDLRINGNGGDEWIIRKI